MPFVLLLLHLLPFHKKREVLVDAEIMRQKQQKATEKKPS
ncbi:1801_t:CDS:2 [Diversispora eburnea]|uniref:1801_t:CDS:1 n=1 Tax=Diversispora eburnea TaxID=1213867 RepID=A0A9N8VS06_9GLOM|nr:1801_t:CDS:2 [Diversispora eburnea]